eukprot:GEMP01040184.1.p1 GENE.GEMP01040184.1~~GEMP01040184.1.p1  ORF type:complete len:141 (+),score=47.11 GEMP01040184.1:92-514(+)
MDGQDWSPQVWSKTATGTQKGVINQARREGGAVDTEEKFTSGNRAGRNVVPNAKKLDDDHETYKHERVCQDFTMALQQARLAKKMTQAVLANAICEKQTVVAEYENGKAIPNGAIIQKLNRALGVNLPRAKAKAKAKPKA